MLNALAAPPQPGTRGMLDAIDGAVTRMPHLLLCGECQAHTEAFMAASPAPPANTNATGRAVFAQWVAGLWGSVVARKQLRATPPSAVPGEWDAIAQALPRTPPTADAMHPQTCRAVLTALLQCTASHVAAHPTVVEVLSAAVFRLSCIPVVHKDTRAAAAMARVVATTPQWTAHTILETCRQCIDVLAHGANEVSPWGPAPAPAAALVSQAAAVPVVSMSKRSTHWLHSNTRTARAARGLGPLAAGNAIETELARRLASAPAGCASCGQ
jgi:hypothetical protein